MSMLRRILVAVLAATLFGGSAIAQPPPIRGGSGPGFVPDAASGPTALGALNARASVALAGRAGAEIVVEAGTLVATGSCEVSRDNATTWEAASCWFVNPTTGAVGQTQAFTNPNAYTSLIPVWVGSATHVSIKLTAYTSGTANANARAMVNTNIVMSFGWDGTKLVPLTTVTAGSKNGLAVIPIDPATGNAITPSAVDGSDRARVVGSVAHGVVNTGDPVGIGGVVRTSLPTAEANGDRVDAMFDKFGRLVSTAEADRALLVSGSPITLSNTTETTLLAAGGAGVFHDLTRLRCQNTSGTVVRVDIRDATGGTVRDTLVVGADGGGITEVYRPVWAQTTANNNWTAQLSASVADVRCKVWAVKNQ